MTAPQRQRSTVYPNLYKDSVALMAISSALMQLDGIDVASVVMATDANRANLRGAGLPDDAGGSPNDLLVVVRGDDAPCEQALELADRLLADQPDGDSRSDSGVDTSLTSIRAAVARDPSANLAMISVPGPYAGAEALKALRLGLDVMIFSDNVPVEQEIELKTYAEAHKLLVMGPDCGTALINGLPLGFANAVRRGRIGVVGASGTGMQEITCRVHQLGAGISHALGTGSHDLSVEVGGVSTLHALHVLADDEATEVIVLVSKPPSPDVATKVLEAARDVRTPVVVMFVGGGTTPAEADSLHVATTLAGAADVAVALAEHGAPDPAVNRSSAGALPETTRTELRATAARLASSQRHVRGVFAGGTFCYEAQLLCQAAGIRAFSNTPVAGNPQLPDIWTSAGDTIIDMGDDAFTRGRPHPMIDPTLRDERLLAEAADPGTAVLLFDVVLGYGAAADPTSHLVEILQQGRASAADAGRYLPVIAHVCGTDDDPQHRSAVVTALRAAGVLVAESNAHAAAMAAFLVSAIPASARTESKET